MIMKKHFFVLPILLSFCLGIMLNFGGDGLWLSSAEAQSVVLATGWEDGQNYGFGDRVEYSRYVAGYYNSFSPPPECSRRYHEIVRSGDYALMIAGYSQASYAYCYYRVFDLNLPVVNGMKISYWIFHSQGTPKISVDGHFTDGTNGWTIRDFNNNGFLTDQYRVRIHPGHRNDPMNGWYYVEVDLSRAAGKTLAFIMFAFDNGSDGFTGQYRAYVDDFRIFVEGFPPNCQASVPQDHWKGEYFNNNTLSASPTMVRDDGEGFISFDWGAGSPSTTCGIGADNFSVGWTRTVNFNAGNYQFVVRADDGVRLWIDNQLVLDKWIDQALTTYTIPVTLSPGNHPLKVEYYENRGGAVAQVSWKEVAPSQFVITATAGPGGTINPLGEIRVNSGADQTFTIAAGTGFQIADVKVDGTSKGAINSYSFPAVTSNYTIDASFAPLVTQFVITASAGTGGTINPSGQVSVAYGGQQTFTVIPASGYGIDQVLVDAVSKGAISSYTFTFENVTSDHTITASFQQQPGSSECTSGGIPSDYYEELCTPRTLPVLVINYIPVGTSVDSTTVLRGQENDTYTGNAVIHCEETGIPDGCERSGSRMLARDRLPHLKNSANLVANFLTEATRFHGYKDPSAPPALTFQIVDTVTILQKQDVPNDPLWPNGLGYRRGYPLGDNQYRDPFRYIFETANICQYMKENGVRLVFYNTYFYHGSVPAESFSAGPLGNVGNSEWGMSDYIAYCRNGAPVSTPQEADVTYHAIGYGPMEGTFPPGNTIEDFTHHLEALFRRADYNLWQSRFVGPEGHQDRAYMGWWVPGLLPGNYFNDPKVINTWGLKIWVDAIHVPGNRSAILHIEPVPGVNPPDRNWPPGDTTPNVQFNVPFTIASELTVALEGKDIKIQYWENAGKAFFSVYRPSADYAVVKRCGWTHYPPNGEGDYNWGNAYWRVRTDCEDWWPDQRGEILADIDCRRWTGTSSGLTCPHDPNPSTNNMGADLGFKKWWMQNIPGLGNGIVWNESGETRHVRNFWTYISDYHGAIQKNSRLSFAIQRIESGAPTALNLARAGNGISLTWAAPPNGADGYNVFRAVSPSGPFYRVNNQLITAQTYFDDFVLTEGTTYYYDVRSVKQVQSETGAQGSITFQEEICKIYLPYLRNESGATSIINIQNTASILMRIRMTFYDSSGSIIYILENTIGPKQTARYDLSQIGILKGGYLSSAVIEVVEPGSNPCTCVNSLSVVVETQANGKYTAYNGILFDEAENWPSKYFYLPWVAKDGQTQSIIHLQNVGEQGAEVTMNFFDPNGSPTYTSSLSLPRRHSSFSFRLDTPFIGSAEVFSNQPLAVVVELEKANGGSTIYNGFSRGTTNFFAPIIYHQYQSQYQTKNSEIIVMNLEQQRVNVDMFYYPRDSCFGGFAESIMLEPRAISFTGTVLPNNFFGSAEISASGDIAVLIKDLSGIYNGFADYNNSSKIYAAPVYNQYGGIDSFVTVMNTNNIHNALVSFKIRDNHGDLITSLSDWVCPQGLQIFYLPVISDLPGNFLGSVEIESFEYGSGPIPIIAVIENRRQSQGDSAFYNGFNVE
jgi:hypothetical protein